MATSAIAIGALALQGYATQAGPALRHRARANEPAMLSVQNVKSAAIGAALAATLAVGPASAADPWPYSTLLSKVNADEVAKVRALTPSRCLRSARLPSYPP